MSGIHTDSQTGYLVRELPGLVLKSVTSVGCVLAAWLVWGDVLIEACLPFVAQVFEWVGSDFKLHSLDLRHQGADRVVHITVSWKHMVVVGDQVMHPHPLGTAYASTLAAHTLVGPSVSWCCATVWPTESTAMNCHTQKLVQLLLRWLVVLLLSVALVALDTPIVLAGELWKLVFDQLALHEWSVVVLWGDFMQAGGRYALGLAAGALSVIAARYPWARTQAAP